MIIRIASAACGSERFSPSTARLRNSLSIGYPFRPISPAPRPGRHDVRGRVDAGGLLVELRERGGEVLRHVLLDEADRAAAEAAADHARAEDAAQPERRRRHRVELGAGDLVVLFEALVALAHEDAEPPHVARAHRRAPRAGTRSFSVTTWRARRYIESPMSSLCASSMRGGHVAQALDPAFHFGDYRDRLGALLLPLVIAAVARARA